MTATEKENDVIIIPNTSREYRRSSIEQAKSIMQHNRADHFYVRRPLRLSENPFSYNRLFTYPQHPNFLTHTVNVFSQFVNRVAGE